MDAIVDIMIRRLVAKGMEIRTVPAYIRDVANTNAGNASLSLQELKG